MQKAQNQQTFPDSRDAFNNVDKKSSSIKRQSLCFLAQVSRCAS